VTRTRGGGGVQRQQSAVVQQRDTEQMTAVECAREFLPKQKMGAQYIADPHPITKPATCPKRLRDHAINVKKR